MVALLVFCISWRKERKKNEKVSFSLLSQISHFMKEWKKIPITISSKTASFLLKKELVKLMTTPIEAREERRFAEEKEKIKNKMEDQRRTQW